MVLPPLEWQDDPARAPVAPPFTGWRQHHLPAMEMSPLDVIQSFVDNEFYSEVVTHTNEYASQCINGSTRRSGMAEWRPIDNLEIRKFFGLHFLFKISGATVSGDSTLYYNLLIHRYPTINIEKVILTTSQQLLTKRRRVDTKCTTVKETQIVQGQAI